MQSKQYINLHSLETIFYVAFYQRCCSVFSWLHGCSLPVDYWWEGMGVTLSGGLLLGLWFSFSESLLWCDCVNLLLWCNNFFIQEFCENILDMHLVVESALRFEISFISVLHILTFHLVFFLVMVGRKTGVLNRG